MNYKPNRTQVSVPAPVASATSDNDQDLTTTDASTHAQYVSDIHQSLNGMGRKLAWIRDNKSYRETHKTFAAFCKDEFETSQSVAYRLIDGSQVIDYLKSSPIGELLPTNESQIRPLLSLRSDDGGKGSKRTLDMKKVGDVWQTVAEKAEADGKPITASRVKAEVDLWKADSEPYIELPDEHEVQDLPDDETDAGVLGLSGKDDDALGVLCDEFESVLAGFIDTFRPSEDTKSWEVFVANAVDRITKRMFGEPK